MSEPRQPYGWRHPSIDCRTSATGLRPGRLPDKGEAVKVDRWGLEGLDVQRRATTQVRLLVPLTAGDDQS